MEVASIFTSKAELIDSFDRFIYSYVNLNFENRDEDTAYFTNSKTRRLEIYYHFKLSDVKYEFAVNFSPKDVAEINGHFDKMILMFDISFRDKIFFDKLLLDFKRYIHDHAYLSDILVKYPFKSIRLL